MKRLPEEYCTWKRTQFPQILIYIGLMETFFNWWKEGSNDWSKQNLQSPKGLWYSNMERIERKKLGKKRGLIKDKTVWTDMLIQDDGRLGGRFWSTHILPQNVSWRDFKWIATERRRREKSFVWTVTFSVHCIFMNTSSPLR